MDEISFENAVISDVPYKHFVIDNFLNQKHHDNALFWFENFAEWKYVKNNFSTHHVVHINSRKVSKELQSIVNEDIFHLMINFIEKTYNVSLSKKVDTFAIKMIKGCSMSIHNDYGPHQQAFRIQVYINAKNKWDYQKSGGVLMLFDQAEPLEVNGAHRYYSPLAKRAIGFKITKTSFHAVSPLMMNERFTLIYSFYNS